MSYLEGRVRMNERRGRGVRHSTDEALVSRSSGQLDSIG